MKHLGTVTLETNRLILRRFKVEDAKSMYENWANDKEVTKYLTWAPHENEEASRMRIQMIIESYQDLETYEWGIELKEIHQLIGSIGVVDLNNEISKLEVGYCIGKSWWNKGIMSEAFSEVIKFFMEDVGMNRIEAHYEPENIHSGDVMKKCGLSYEGTLRQSAINSRGVCDIVCYGILKEDYR